MKGLVSSVRAGGVHQPALVRPREGGGYEIIAGHRRQRASELAGYKNMPCIVRNMTDDEAVLAMTDDNLRHRETILPSEKAAALKQHYVWECKGESIYAGHPAQRRFSQKGSEYPVCCWKRGTIFTSTWILSPGRVICW